MLHPSSTLDKNVQMDYQEIFNQLPGCFLVLQPNAPHYTILAISEELLQITARTRQDVVGKGVYEVYPENENATTATGPSQLRISLENTIKHKKVDYMPLVRYDVTNQHGEFETRYWSAYSKPVLNADGELKYIIHTTSDITEQIKAQNIAASFQKIEKAYSLFMQAPVAVSLVAGPEYVVEFSNEQMLKILDLSPSVVGKPIFEAMPELLDQGIPELLDQVRKSGEPFHATEFPAQIMMNGQKELRYYNYIYQPYYQYDGDSSPYGVFIVAHDVTEQVLARKKVEEVKEQLDIRNALFEAHNEATPDGVLIVDTKGNMLLQNKRFAEIWGMPQYIIDSQDDHAALEFAKKQVVDEQGFMNNVTAAYTKASGLTLDMIKLKNGRVIERTGAPVVSENGLSYGWAWYFRDATERLMQEQKFQNVVEQATDLIAIFKGEDLVVEVANKALLELWQLNTDALGKPFEVLMPEMRAQGFIDRLQKVFYTGEPEFGYEIPAVFKRRNGTDETVYFNFSYQPYRETDGSITGVIIIAKNVNEQIANKYKLIESESRFRTLVRDASVGIIVLTGEEMRVEIVNDAYAKLIDRRSDELTNKPLFSIIPEAEAVFRPIIDKVRTTGEPVYLYDMPYFVYVDGKKKDGFLNLVYQPYKDYDGNIIGVMVLCHDVTRQVLALKKLEEEKERAKMAMEAGDLGMFEFDAETKCVISDQRFTELSGLEKIDSIEQYFNAIHPEDRHLKDAAIQEGLKSGLLDFESRVVASNGQVRWIKLKGRFFFTEDGKPTKVIGMIQDVTAQRSFAEELKKFKHISDHALDAFILMREDSTFAYLNDLALKRWGYTKEEALNIKVPDVDPIYQEKEFREVFALTQKQNIPPFETIHQRKDGTTFPVEVSLTGLTLEGKPHMFAVARDITDRKAAEETLLSKNEQLVRINNDLDNFIYTASHDLKAPISNIEGLLSLLAEDLGETKPNHDEIRHIVTLMQGSVNRFKKTITSLTDVVRLQQENTLSMVQVDLSEVIKDITLDLEPELKAAGVQLEVNVSECTSVRFSEKNLRSVIYNLLSNAIKYRSPERTPKVQLTCTSTAEHHVITVADNGLGINSNRKDQLFSMFKRFHDHVEGTGIGLYMVKKMVDNAGGRIDVESQVNVGTTFRIYLNK